VADSQLVFGIHAVQAALDNQSLRGIELLVQAGDHNGKIKQICASAARAGMPISQVRKKILDEQCDGAIHQGVLLTIKPAVLVRESDLDSLLQKCTTAPLVLALDGVQDPHNLGACLRTAEAMGVDAVIAPKDGSCDITPAVRKVASGAAERVPFVRVTNLARTLKSLQKSGLWVSGAASEADSALGDVDFTQPSVLVLGAEGSGMRNLTRRACDYIVSIPMSGTVGSFNVSVACGICLYEIIRQRTVAV
jgi:23S rRNA (guanosine2251-2'-O)-methyltransferase